MLPMQFQFKFPWENAAWEGQGSSRFCLSAVGSQMK